MRLRLKARERTLLLLDFLAFCLGYAAWICQYTTHGGGESGLPHEGRLKSKHGGTLRFPEC